MSSPRKDKIATNDGPNDVRNNIVDPIDTLKSIETNTLTDETMMITTNPTTNHHRVEPDFIDKMQTEMNGAVAAENDVTIFTNDTEKYRQMLPYNTIDPEKINQQESILELLISNGICDDETFKIFIAEPDLHKDKASQILDGLYCVSTMISIEYENEWVNSVESMATTSDTAIASPPDLTLPAAAISIDTNSGKKKI